MFSLEELFCSVDDFCFDFESSWNQQLLTQGKCRFRNRRLSLSEIMTIEIAFHLSAHKNFKIFYLEIVSCYWRKAFPNLVSYNRFVEWQPSTLIPLMTYLRSRLGKSTGIGLNALRVPPFPSGMSKPLRGLIRQALKFVITDALSNIEFSKRLLKEEKHQ